MKSSRKIGRLSLLKYYIIFIIIVLSIPVIIELFNRESFDVLTAIKAAFKVKPISGSQIFLPLIHLIIFSAAIWLIGGKLGESIIDTKKSKFGTSFIALLQLWLLYFLNSAIIHTLSNYDQTPQHLIINGIVMLLYMSISLGIIHGLIFSYFMGKEIERKGCRLKSENQPF